MQLKYREDKATQAAARLLLLEGGEMNYMKLLTLLYLADRRALVQWGRPITFDSYFSLDNGPVLSFTYNNISSEPEPDGHSYWHQYIAAPQNYSVALANEAPSDRLSSAELELLESTYREFGHMDQWQLRDYTHEHLPEWKDPNGSAHPIELSDILLSEGWSDDEIKEIEESLQAETAAQELLG